MTFARFAMSSMPGRSRCGRTVRHPSVLAVLAMLLMCLTAMLPSVWLTPAAMAVQTGTMTNEITDPQNLLGSNVSAVTDKIKETEETTGVHVRLQYVESFGTDAKPSTWASRALEATNPEPNTVLLAVASGDGNLVVAVSSNSDEWLRDEATVDELSKAATAPLAKQNDQNWSGAAIAMMNEIKQQKQTSTNSRTIRIGVIVMGVVLVLLVVVIVITVIVRRRRGERKASGGKAAKEGKTGGKTPSPEPSGQSGPSEPSEGETTMADLLGAIEKEGASGEKPMSRRELREARKGKRGILRRK